MEKEQAKDSISGQIPFELPLEKQTNATKNAVHSAISTNNWETFLETMNEFNVDPHEEISEHGYYWTCMHYAAHFKRAKMLEYLLKLAHKRYPKDFVRIVNIQTKEGWSPLMISSIYKSYDELKVLYLAGGVLSHLVDKTGKTAGKLAEFYGAIECFEYIKMNEKKISNINVEYLTSEGSYDSSKDPKHHALLLNGIRKPCLFCNSNFGFLRYCRQCGVPMHKLCVKENGTKCKGCNREDIELTADILFPEKAFSLEM